MDSIYTIVVIWRGLFEEVFAFKNYDDAVKKWESLTGLDYSLYEFYNENASNKQINEYYLNEVVVD